MLVSRFPYPLEKGDKLRAYYQLQELCRYYEVTLVAISGEKVSAAQMEEISKYCKAVYIGKTTLLSRAIHTSRCFLNNRPFQTGYFYSWKIAAMVRRLIANERFDHIYCQLLRTAEYVKNEHRIPKTLDYMDALSAGIQRRIDQQPWYKRWIFKAEARRLAAYERSVFDYFEHKTIISAQDRELIQHPERRQIHIIPNGIHASFFEHPKVSQEYDFVFVGNMSYPPNMEAVRFIVSRLLPEFPGTTLLVSGSSPDPSLIQLSRKNPHVHITGWVDDIRASYCRGKIFLAPMMIGTGMQNKLLEAMALGIPCVTTPLANNAIGAAHEKEIMVGNSPEELIEGIHRLRTDADLYAGIAENASNFVRRTYSWEKSVRELTEVMKTSGTTRHDFSESAD